MFLAYERARSTTYGFITPPPASNALYHDLKRGWLMRALQNKALNEFKDSAFEMDPAPDTIFPEISIEGGPRTECWVCGKKKLPVSFRDRCECFHVFSRTLLRDRWLRCLSFVHDDTGCVTVEFNAQKGMLLTCCTTKVELYDQIDGAVVATDPVRLSDLREVVPDARYAVDVLFSFGVSFKRAEYEKLGEKVFVSLHKMLRLLEGCKRARIEYI